MAQQRVVVPNSFLLPDEQPLASSSYLIYAIHSRKTLRLRDKCEAREDYLICNLLGENCLLSFQMSLEQQTCQMRFSNEMSSKLLKCININVKNLNFRAKTAKMIYSFNADFFASKFKIKSFFSRKNNRRNFYQKVNVKKNPFPSKSNLQFNSKIP